MVRSYNGNRKAVLGIDLSGHSCGYAVLRGPDDLLEHGTLTPTGDYWERQRAIVVRLEALMDAHNPVRVVFEKIRLFHQGKIALAAIEDLGRLSGAIGYVATLHGIQIETVHTAHYRLRVLGDGKATKDDVVQWVKEHFEFDPPTTDEAEAVAIGVYGALVNGNGQAVGTPKRAVAGRVTRRRSR